MEKQIKVLKPEMFIEFESDGFVQIKDLKKGDIIYECEEFDRKNTELLIITDIITTNKSWEFSVKDSEGEIHDIYISKKYKNFHKFYQLPIFLDKINKSYGYVIS